jgi:hypothetical protein
MNHRTETNEELVELLDRELGPLLERHAVVGFVDVVEARLPELVEASIVDRIQAAASSQRLAFNRSASGFLFGSHLCSLAVVQSEDTLLIKIFFLRTAKKKQRTRTSRSRVDGLGRVRKISLQLGEELVDLESLVLSVATGTYVIGYRWLEAQVLGYLNSLHDQTANELYTAIRKRLPPKVAELVWLGLHADGRSYYLVDNGARQVLVDQAQRLVRRGMQSPLDLVGHIESSSIPFDVSASRQAIQEGAPIPHEVITPRYDLDFGVAETAIYRTGRIVVQPLVREGSTLMTAGYPAELEREVGELLSNLAPEFGRIIRFKQGAVRRLISQLKKRGLSTEAMAEIAHVLVRAGQALIP